MNQDFAYMVNLMELTRKNWVASGMSFDHTSQ
jgi:hypothetical protein